MSKILEHFEGRKEQIVRQITQLVEIESPSRDASGVSAVADWLESRLEKVPGITTTERIPAEGYGEHVVFRAFEGDAKAALMMGHIDTVHPRGTKEYNPTRTEDGRLYGCGVFDMKASVVLMIEAVRAITELGLQPKRPVNILLSCDEEIGSPTGRPIVEREAARAAFALVCEPSANGAAKTGRKGTAGYKLVAHGIPAHAGLEPEKGASAILEIARQIGFLHGLNDLSTGTTVNVCVMHGGTTTNVIPSLAECDVDVRFTSMAEAERIDSAIRSLKSHDERVRLEIQGAINRPPLERTEAVAAIFEKARRIASGMGYELAETQVGGASDGNFVGAMGVPVLDGLGVKGDGAHTLREHIEVDDLPFRAALLTELLLAD
jgi:glutamate carboxypeptidase